jgi:Mg-chelatase subunit ChlD
MPRIGVNFGTPTNAVTTATTGTPAKAGLSFRDRVNMKPTPPAGIEQIQLLLDVSGSMSNFMDDGVEKMEAAKGAVRHFLKHSNPHKCGVGLIGFGFSYTPVQNLQALTYTFGLIDVALDPISAEGGTPMHEALQAAVDTGMLSRAIVVSDGIPDDAQSCFKIAEIVYKERGYPIDCIYIGREHDRGYDFMKKLAKMTGGIFAFAGNLKAFETAFAQLETSARLQLSDHRGK